MANKDKLLESAQKFLAKGQLAKAIGEYQKLIEAFPKDYRNRQKLAELLSREKRNEEAQPHYEAVARNFTDTGFYLKAIAIYKQMQKIEPGRVDIYLRLAELNEKQGLIGNALNEYRSLVAFYDKNRMVRESVGILQKMIALDPENLGFRGKLIETLVAIDEKDDALEQLRTLVNFLSGKGESAKVVKLYEKFLDICPEDVDTRLPLAEALLATAQAEKALVLLKSLLKLTPDHPALLTVLTDCHMALGSHDDARLTCQHLLKDQPQNLDLRERYVRICIAGNDYERALESLEESKEQFYQAERVAVLKELYEELQSVLADNPRLKATLAALYRATGAGDAVSAAAPAPSTADVAEETADAALVDAAISDVEQLDLVGEAVVPPAAVPPLGAPAPAAPAKSGFELELDLDLEMPPAAPPRPEPAPAPVSVPEPVSAPEPPAAPKAESLPAPPSLEMELELDLGGLDELELEPPAAEPPAATVAPESPPEPPPVAEADVEVQISEPAAEEFSLPEFGDLEFEVEAPAVADAPSVDEVTGLDVPGLDGLLVIEPDVAVPTAAEVAEFAEAFELEAPELSEATEPVESFEAFATAAPEESDGLETTEERDEFEELEDVEELEELEELENLEEPEEIAAAEEFEDSGEYQEAEEFEEAEPLEELEELDEFDEFAGEIETAAPAAAPPSRLRDEIEEAEFYLRQGLLDDAERLVLGMQQNHGEHPELAAMLTEIGAQRQTLVETEPKDALFDLMADIKDSELLGATDFLGEADGGADAFSLDATAEEDEDAQSHFDLGIAYKEMGLLDDAITEFGKALRDPSRQLDCLTLKGQCLAELGHFDKAETTYKEGLMLIGLTEEGMIALRYELGLLYETLGRPVEALESFQVVADRDLFYRDVTDKLKALRQQLGIDDQAIESVSEGGSGRDRISFL